METENESKEKMYITILSNSILEKEKILKQLLELTSQQEQCMSEQTVDMDEFKSLMDKKDIFIQQLAKIDDGFDPIYQRVSKELEQKKDYYKQEIKFMQEHIVLLTDLGVQLQKKEIENRNKVELFLSKKKTEIKNFKMNNKTVSNYYKNIGGNTQGESYFMDTQK